MCGKKKCSVSTFNDSFIAEVSHTRIWKDSREKSRHYQSLWQSFTKVSATHKEGKENKSIFALDASEKKLLFVKNFVTIWKALSKIKFTQISRLKQCIKTEN